MKNYYQQKKGGWKLEPVIYAKTVKQIQCYRFFQKMLAEKSYVREDGILQEAHVTGRQVAEKYVRAVDLGLKRYVPEAYRDAVFAHMVDGKGYAELEETCFTSSSTLKRYVQAFVWGVAEELGENF
ncbi:MAG: hypothetical protein IJ109_03265 [Firmicutes bacterium]|nr:hypothetical protein [Bacillota bacterium]